jgi:WD40 repeat protein
MKKVFYFLFLSLFISISAKTQVFIKTIKGPEQMPTSCAFSADGKKIYVGSYDKLIWVYDLATGKVSDTIKFHDGPVTTLDVSSKGLMASSGWDKQVAVWESGSRQPKFVMKGHIDKVNCVKFSADGAILASGSDDGKVIFWDVITGGKIKEIQAHKDPVTYVGWRSDGNVIATTSWDKKVKLWSVQTGELIAELTGHRNVTNFVVYSNSDKFFISTSDDNSMILWETDSNKVFKKFEFYKKPVAGALFINNDQQIISFDHEGEIKIYNNKNHQMLSLKQAHSGKIVSFAWSPSMALMATLGVDKNIHLWDLSEYTHFECLKTKLPSIEFMKKPKDEFETTEQYERRLADYDKRKIALVEECKKDIVLEQQALEKMKLEKEAEAYSYVTVSFTGIGVYNADKVEYPVMIGKQTFYITMQLEDAKSFKENWQKAKVKSCKKRSWWRNC